MTYKRLSTVFACAALIALFQTPAQADWGEEALKLQEQLDVNIPLNETMWVGTHNSYNSSNWDSAYSDENQTLSPKEQLRAGARELTFDVYYYGLTDGLLLCHKVPLFNCGGQEKTFRDGLRQIRDFIDEGNENSVILLKLELEIDGYLGMVAYQLEDMIADYIYKPSLGVISIDGAPAGRHGLEPEHLTKADVLKAGKNIILLYAAGELDEDPPSTFTEWVHVGFEYDSDGWSNKFSKPGDVAECEYLRSQGKMTRIHDGNTWFNVGGGGASQIFNSESTISEYMECGLNVIELFNYDGANATGWYEPRPEHLVWSWKTDQPDGYGDCGLLNDNRLLYDVPCTETRRYSCYAESADRWRVTTGMGQWGDGDQACLDEFGADYVFAMPTNAPQFYALFQQMNNEAAWVDYHDLSVEGVWQANNDVRLTVYDEFGDGDITTGSVFDDFPIIERSLITGELRSIQSVRIKAGARVDGFEVTYSDGTSFYRGGGGGSWSNELRLQDGEFIQTVERCLYSHNNTVRVFYLGFKTNLNQEISGGTYGGACSQHTSTHPIYAFYGRAGEELDTIGVYSIDVQNAGTSSGLAIFDENGVFGGTSGAEYDDRYLIEQGIAAGDLRTIESVRIKAGSRVDAFEVTYSDGTSFHRGGGGGSWTDTLTLNEGEYIDAFVVCVGRRKGNDRIFFLMFETNQARLLGGGSFTDDCTPKTFEHPLYGFYGAAGSELDSIGFYTVGYRE